MFEGQRRLGVLGLISSESAPFCEGCNRLRLTSTGQIIPCLTHAAGPSVRALLQSCAPDAEQEILRRVEEQMAQKCRRPGFEMAGPMATVGG